ncbi:MAG: hypothetical protein HZB16_14565 [Armatimonadetes bacterium]|nr:hypothetical protein [Armatimonadota bacterium]
MRRLCAVLAVAGSLLLSACGPRAPQQVQVVPQPEPMRQAPMPAPAPAPPKSMPQSAGKPTTLAKADPVYITQSGKKYHRADCQHLAKSAAKMARAQAQKQGYTACDTCKP